MSRKRLVRRLVVKIGTSLVTKGGHLDRRWMARLVNELAGIQRSGVEVLLVSSGAIAAGMGELGWRSRPAELAKKQAAAAVGQPRLMETYRQLFRRSALSVAQVLLTREDFEQPGRSANARATLLALLAERVIPIINENDTVAVEEIRLGDNDTLAARVAVTIHASLLVLLTDVEGLMTRHPKEGRGELVREVSRIDAVVDRMAQGESSEHGTGGMRTKVQAARLATSGGVDLVIADGRTIGLLARLMDGECLGTHFHARRSTRRASAPLQN